MLSKRLFEWARVDSDGDKFPNPDEFSKERNESLHRPLGVLIITKLDRIGAAFNLSKEQELKLLNETLLSISNIYDLQKLEPESPEEVSRHSIGPVFVRIPGKVDKEPESELLKRNQHQQHEPLAT